MPLKRVVLYFSGSPLSPIHGTPLSPIHGCWHWAVTCNENVLQLNAFFHTFIMNSVTSVGGKVTLQVKWHQGFNINNQMNHVCTLLFLRQFLHYSTTLLSLCREICLLFLPDSCWLNLLILLWQKLRQFPFLRVSNLWSDGLCQTWSWPLFAGLMFNGKPLPTWQRPLLAACVFVGGCAYV